MYADDDLAAMSQYYGTQNNQGYYDEQDDPFMDERPGASSPSPQFTQYSAQGPSYHQQSQDFDRRQQQAYPASYDEFGANTAGYEYEAAYDVPEYPHQPSTSAARQPRSYAPSSYSSQTMRSSQASAQNQYTQRQSNPQIAPGIRLVPVSTLPDVYRSIFKFGVFNAMQSRCYESAANSDDNMVISSPTGSGKTVLFELAIIRLLMQSSKDAKCVYIAPTKALCTERSNDWTKKFQHMGIKCCELTGDTVDTSRKAWNDAKSATIIVTTPEKWDSLTRNWRDHQAILAQMQLFLVDEVHILNETRGSTLEVCISRMKTRGSAVRFVLLSATAPNIEDIANWIGSGAGSGTSAKVFKFGEEYRPCKITRHVYSYAQKNQSVFHFARSLDFKLFELLQRHACGKPVLIFCPTRKGVTGTSEQLAKDYQKCADDKKKLPWALPPRSNRTFQDSQLTNLLASGLGAHHAGMSMDDRRLTEELYLSGQIRALTATSTLAVGVNLPAHTVVIKGTQMWAGSGWVEYCDLDIMQMIGRAGRPQFDKEGLALIMCSTDVERRYKALTSGTTIIESCLHLNLTEHLNSEVGLGTITSMDSAKTWLHNSFLFQRLQRNPAHYALGKDQNQTWQERLDDLVSDSVKSLCGFDLVKATSDSSGKMAGLEATEYGEIMSKYYIRYSTMGLILKLQEKASLREILETVAQADEFSDVRIRGSDKTVYNAIKEHIDIRMSMKKIEKPADKVMVLIQAVLGGIPLNAREYKTADSQPILEALGVFRHASRIAKAVVDTAIAKKHASLIKYGLELVRSLSAKAWDDRPIVLRQISHIGEKSIKVLATSGITTLAKLRKENAHRIELLLNRKPPFGTEVIAEAAAFPQYTIRLTEESVTHSNGQGPVTVTISVEVGLVSPVVQSKNKKALSMGWACMLTMTSDYDFIDFRRVGSKALQQPRSFTVSTRLDKPSQSIIVIVSSEQHAGLAVEESYRPSLSPGKYPTLKTRPKTELEAEIEALNNDDPALWTITEEEDTDITSDKPSAKTGAEHRPVITSSSQRTQGPARLPNGNYACNHVCKDRQNCRHLCCKEGLPKPPVARSAKTLTAPTSRSPEHRISNSNKPKSNPPTAKASTTIAADSTMKDLDRFHASARSGSTVQSGRRLSLAVGPSKLAKKPRPTWTPDFPTSLPSFSNLANEEIDELANENDDELPELDEVLKAKVKDNRGDSTDYSDAEMDALLATTDFDQFFGGGASSSKGSGASARGTKRNGTSPGDDIRGAKKPKLAPIESESYPTPIPITKQPLFLSSSSSPTRRSRPQPLQEHADVFTVDELAEMEADPLAAEDVDPVEAMMDFDPQYFDFQDDATQQHHSERDEIMTPAVQAAEAKKVVQQAEVVVEPEPEPEPEIAPGVERTGFEAFDNFLDWVYNSGDVELVD